MSNGMREVMERAAIIAEASADGPVTKVWLSKWVKSDREPGRLLSNPYIFAVYYKLPEDDHRALDRMAPVSLTVTADELRAINS
ncbi:hypothetical protein [Microbacterium paludicola]|uniref:hypothetical protein n=1 Tax=Microbacterium paludicola TaxID=300019 RepID=UPI0011A35B8B|nr:hypothetical protein [Microbacterium paludicola]